MEQQEHLSDAEKKRIELAQAWRGGLLTIEELRRIIIDERLRELCSRE